MQYHDIDKTWLEFRPFIVQKGEKTLNIKYVANNLIQLLSLKYDNNDSLNLDYDSICNNAKNTVN